MKHTNNIETVSAYGRLLEYSSNKRYGLIDNKFRDDIVDHLALQLNALIKQQSGLDILELEDEREITEYEDLVDRLLTKFTYEHIIPADNSDEGRLLKESYPVSISFVKELKIQAGPEFRDCTRGFPITIPTWISYCKTAHAAYAINADGIPAILFLTTKLQLRGKNRLGLLVLFRGTGTDQKEWHLAVAGIFSKESYMSLIDSPVKMFLSYLNDYSYDLSLNGERKKLFYKTSFPRTISMDDLKVKIHDIPNAKPSYNNQIAHRFTALGIYILIAFTIRDYDNLQDALLGRV